jgi:hypothetical protein
MNDTGFQLAISHQIDFHGPNKYTFGRFGGNMDTINTIGAILSSQDVVKLKYEGADLGDDAFV